MEPTINLERVGTDNFGADFGRDVGRKFGFSTCRWPDDEKCPRHPMRRCGDLLLARGFDDLGEAARVEAGTADEGAVDVGLDHEFASVLWFHAAAVLNSHSLGCR